MGSAPLELVGGAMSRFGVMVGSSDAIIIIIIIIVTPPLLHSCVKVKPSLCLNN
jgi:hypothetical protein